MLFILLYIQVGGGADYGKFLAVSEESVGKTGQASGKKKVVNFRLEGGEGGEEVEYGVVGDGVGLGKWDAAKCLRMQAHQEHGHTVYTASVEVLIVFIYVFVFVCWFVCGGA